MIILWLALAFIGGITATIGSGCLFGYMAMRNPALAAPIVRSFMRSVNGKGKK
jgi:hypothetical protein